MQMLTAVVIFMMWVLLVFCCLCFVVRAPLEEQRLGRKLDSVMLDAALPWRLAKYEVSTKVPPHVWVLVSLSYSFHQGLSQGYTIRWKPFQRIQ